MRFFVPDGDLHFADMHLVQHDHAKAGLPDAAAHRQGQFARGERPVKGQLEPICAAFCFC